jgi:hypothetical protein
MPRPALLGGLLSLVLTNGARCEQDSSFDNYASVAMAGNTTVAGCKLAVCFILELFSLRSPH